MYLVSIQHAHACVLSWNYMRQEPLLVHHCLPSWVSSRLVKQHKDIEMYSRKWNHCLLFLHWMFPCSCPSPGVPWICKVCFKEFKKVINMNGKKYIFIFKTSRWHLSFSSEGKPQTLVILAVAVTWSSRETTNISYHNYCIYFKNILEIVVVTPARSYFLVHDIEDICIILQFCFF